MADKIIAQDYVEEVEKPIDFKYYFYLLAKNFYVILTFFIITVTLATIYVSRMPDQYHSMAQLIIERPKTTYAPDKKETGPMIEGWSEDYYNTQKEIMTSPTVLRQVVEELKLNEYFGNENEEDLIAKVANRMNVERIRNSRIFNINVRAPDAQLAANLANSISRAYIRKNFEDYLYFSKEILAWLPQEQGKSDGDLISVEDPFGGVKQVSRKELIESLPSIQTDETVRELREKKSFLEAELTSLLRQYREKHPLIVKARANMAFLEDSIEAEKARVIEGLKSRAEGHMQVSHARILEEATVPKEPSGPDRQRIVLIAALIEIFVGFLVIFLLDYFDDTLHSLEDMERKGIALPFLGPIPLMKGKKIKPDFTSLVTYHDRKSDIAESFRYLRVAINFSASPESLKNLVITSCLPSEGKSFISHNIAVSLALDGNKTLLVDADLRRPVVHERFRIENEIGLSNYLTSNLEFESVLKECFVENLTVIPSGPVSPNPAEILGSEKMKTFLEEARKRFDRVIIDCPPLTGLGDGYVVGNLVGHVILVIRAANTPSDLISRTHKQLDKMGIKIIGAILNQIDIEKERYKGYSKYYYHTYNRYYNEQGK
ncbi:MAG: polysaccharide biosynthesis tyrosine autokinase [Candidatus Omnitrophica bacterium]|nr:polysaccharide biosynthesis tyrosine autokinase [Candidatus Omnitrophota bacterium]